jgi:hypothetical protein
MHWPERAGTDDHNRIPFGVRFAFQGAVMTERPTMVTLQQQITDMNARIEANETGAAVCGWQP